MMFMLRAHHRQQRDFGWVQTAHCIPLLEAAELLMCYYGGTRLYQHQYLLGLAQYGFYLRWLNSISSPCFVTFLCFLCFSFSPGFKLLTSLNDKYQIIEIARRIFRHWLRLKYQGLQSFHINPL
ncbi:uncharacterized protein LOC141626772 isoform X3 [Silene latifolia]|uniref:uncharacterized protein LOC141626772 isoform X3 n=1 Tax=Silene latifolia TaxID=37657 RepID=UPI003D78A833